MVDFEPWGPLGFLRVAIKPPLEFLEIEGGHPLARMQSQLPGIKTSLTVQLQVITEHNELKDGRGKESQRCAFNSSGTGHLAQEQ